MEITNWIEPTTRGQERIRLSNRLNIAEYSPQFDLLVVLLFGLSLYLTSAWYQAQQLVLGIGAAIGTLYLSRYFLAAYGRSLAQRSESSFLWLQFALTFLWTGTWGLYNAAILAQTALGWTTYFLTVCTLLLASSYVLFHATSLTLLLTSVFATLLPTIMSNAISIPGLRGQATWMMLAVFAGFLVVMGRNHSKKVNEVLLQRSRLGAIVESIPGTICWFNHQLEFLGANSAFFSTFGGKRQSVKSLNDSQVDPLIGQLAQSVFESEQGRVNGAKEVAQKNYYLVGQKYQFGDEALLVGIDISAQESLNQELEIERKRSYQASKTSELNQLLKILVLEEKQNVITIRTLSNLFQEDLTEFWKRVSVLHKAIEDVLDPEIFNTKKRMSMKEVGESIGATFGTFLSEHLVHFHIDGFEEGQINVHPGGILLCLSILLNNSAKALSEQPQRSVRITGSIQNERAQISVEDNGKGIDEDYADMIFEPFFSANSESTSGMGLAILSELIYEYGGTVRVSQVREPTIMTIELPLDS